MIVRDRDPAAERSAVEALREAADAASPAVEEAAPGLLYMDATGLNDELGSARALAHRAAGLGLPARVGLADSRVAARLAAWGAADAPVIVRPGQDAAFLSPQALELLRPSPALSATLSAWGLRLLGELAALPEGQVLARLGREGLELHRAARGIDARPLLPTPRTSELREAIELDWTVDNLETLVALALAPLERLAARLEARGLSCRGLLVDLSLDPTGKDSRRLSLAAPSRDTRTWLALLALDLARQPPRSGVSGLGIALEAHAPRQVQLSLFGPAAQSPDALSTFLARLSALLGPERLGSPVPLDLHRPEAHALMPYDPPPPPDMRTALEPPPERLACALRALRPAVELEMLVGDNEPFRPQEARSLRVSGRVRQASGPWRLEEGWWGDGPTRRDYWDVELSDHAVYRIYRDRDNGRWFADGIYD